MNVKRAILLLIVVGLYLAAVNDHWAPKSDSAIYMGLGRSLVAGRGMMFNGRLESGIPPVAPLLVAACRYVAGPSDWPVNLVMTLMGLGVVVFFWLGIRRLSADLPASTRGAVTMGSLVVVALSARLFLDATRVMTDVPCAFFLMLAFWAVVRARSGHAAWYVVGALAAAVAVLTRVPALVCAVGLLVAAVLDLWRRHRAWAAGGLAIGVGLAAVLVGWWALGFRGQPGPGAVDYVSTDRLQDYTIVHPERWGEILDAAARLPEAVTSTIMYQKLSWFGLVPIGLILVGIWRAARLRQWVVVFPTVLYVALLVVLTPGAVASRYLLPVMPLLVYLMLVGTAAVADPARRILARAAHWLRRGGSSGPARWALAGGLRAGRWLTLRAVPIVAGVCVAISVPKIAREIYWMRHPAFYEVFDGGRWASYRALAHHLADRADPARDSCLTPVCTVVHYWSGVRCESLLLWEGRKVFHFKDLPPETFVRVAADRGDRFVVVPLGDGAQEAADEASWGRHVVAAMEASGAFDAPPARFGRLALFERVSGTKAGARP